MKTPAKRRTGEINSFQCFDRTNLVYRQPPATGDRRVAVSDFNVQHGRMVHRRSGVPATGESPYQISTFNTTEWYTGEAVYRRLATGESPYQIPTFNTTDWCPGELAYRRISSERNNTADQYTDESAYRRQASVERIRTPSVADKMPQLEMTVNTRSERSDRDSKLK